MFITGGMFAGVFAAAVLVSALACFVWLRIAAGRHLLDLPGGRRVHTTATPRGGGIGIALVMVLAFFWAGRTLPANAAPWFAAATATGLLAVMGLLDDLRPMRALAKFAAQLLAVVVLLWPLGLGAANVAVWAAILVVAAVIGWVNLWNFMDGSHGLIAVQALLISLALAALPGQTPAVRLAALALAGACLGFLPFNLPEARLFLGDIGSHAIAAAVIALTLLSVYEHTLSLPEACLLSSVLWVDALITLLRRALAGKTLWRAHREHLYQFAVRRGFAPWRVCAAYAVLTLFAVLTLIASRDWSQSAQWSLVVAWFLALAIAHGLVRRHLLAGVRRRAA